MAKAPQEPAEKSPMGCLDEPVSKVKYQGGVLEWRKMTWPVIGGPCDVKQVVFYDGSWTGCTSDRIIGVNVFNLYDSKGPGPALIDDYIARLLHAVNTH